MYQDETPHHISAADEPSDKFKEKLGSYVNRLPRAYRFLAATQELVIRPVKTLCAFCRDQERLGIEAEQSCQGHMGIQTYGGSLSPQALQKECDRLTQRSFRRIAQELVGKKGHQLHNIFPLLLIPEYVCLYSEERPLPCGNQKLPNSSFWQRQDYFGEIFYHEFWHFIDASLSDKVSASPAFIRMLQEDLNRKRTSKFFPNDCEEFEYFLDFSSEVFADAGALLFMPKGQDVEDSYIHYFPSSIAWVQQFDRDFRLALSSGQPKRIQKFLEHTLGEGLSGPK